SAAAPVFCALAMTLSLQSTFLPAVLVIAASQLDCACTNAPPLRLSTHASASTSMASHGWVCALQSPWPGALVHEKVNLVSHLASLTGSAAAPVFCALAMTLSLQSTFLPAALVIAASQLDCACATPPSVSDSATSP